jgi:hypothetical protein
MHRGKMTYEDVKGLKLNFEGVCILQDTKKMM